MRALLLAVVLGLGGCKAENGAISWVEVKLFGLSGETYFESSERVRVKRVLLDPGALLKRSLRVEGEIVELGKLGAFAVLRDSTGRVLVKLSSVAMSESAQTSLWQRVVLLGRLEYGLGGLPVFAARGIRFL